MADAALRIFSYLPNPRVWKALIAAEICGVRVETVGDAPAALGQWLWDFDARRLEDEDRNPTSPHARTSKRGFAGTLYKTDEFLRAHPFGTVPAAFSPDGAVGIFESNSIMRAAARAGDEERLYGRGHDRSRVDSFLDASLVFAREAQVYLLGLRTMTSDLHERMDGAYGFFLDGIERALSNGPFVAGDSLSLADIAFACDLGQFLGERRAGRVLETVDLKPITTNEPGAHPRAFRHLFRLAERPEFARHFGDYLDAYRDDLDPA